MDSTTFASPPPPHSSQHAAALSIDSFFDLDSLLGPSSRHTSRSPNFPPTPPQLEAEPSFLSIDAVPPPMIGDDFAKFSDLGSLFAPAGGAPGAPYTFPNFFDPPAPFASGSSGSSSGSSPHSAFSPSTIDPQLVDAPTPAMDLSDIEEEDDADIDAEDIGADMNATSPTSDTSKTGKQRKHSVTSGGIVKKTRPSDKKDKKDDLDDWRPSPEEYKKMSSKEKRQLRNKISARNFRTRRKEYITTLEGDIAERDRLIDAIRSELGSTKSENAALREEIDALKKTLLSGHEGPSLPPPGPLPAIPAAITASAAAQVAASRKPLLTPNVHKDLPTSPRAVGGAFWAGNTTSFGGFTPVHTTLVPDFPVFATMRAAPSADVLSGKPAARALQENINPALNGPHPPAAADHAGQQQQQQRPGAPHAFDNFADVNPFTLKTLDAYRMHLWGRMAAHQHAMRMQQHQHQQAAPAQQQQALNGLASNLSPKYFEKSSSSTLGAGPSAAVRDEHVRVAAALASQTLLGRMGSAFWDAFAGTAGPVGAKTPGAGIDADKVRRVLEGKAELRVVDVEPKAAPTQVLPRAAATSARAGLASPASPAQRPVSPRSCLSVTDMLAESMGTLSISKKSPHV